MKRPISLSKPVNGSCPNTISGACQSREDQAPPRVLSQVADFRTIHARNILRSCASLFVRYLDIVGPFNPKPEPPGATGGFSFAATQGRAPGRNGAPDRRKSRSRRAYRRRSPGRRWTPNSASFAARRRVNPLEEGVRLALKTILVSPISVRTERDPRRRLKRLALQHLISEHELDRYRLSYFLWPACTMENCLRVASEQSSAGPESSRRRFAA